MEVGNKFQLNISKIMPPRPKQQWDIGVNTAKVCHLCCGIIMEGNNRKTTKSFDLFRTVMSSS